MKYYDPKPRRRKSTILTSGMAADDDAINYFDPKYGPGKTTILTSRMPRDDDAVFFFDPKAKSTIATAGLGPNDNELRAIRAERAKAKAQAAREQLAQNQKNAPGANAAPGSAAKPGAKPNQGRQEEEKRQKNCEKLGEVVATQVKEMNDLKNQKNKALQQTAAERQIITAIHKEQLGRPRRSAEQEIFIPKPKDIQKDTPGGRRGRGGQPPKNFMPSAGLSRAQNHHAKAKEKAIAEVEKRIEKLRAESQRLQGLWDMKYNALANYHEQYRACLDRGGR